MKEKKGIITCPDVASCGFDVSMLEKELKE